MRVVHIAYKYGLNNTGGAAIAATRLHQALLANGVESHYVCVWKCEVGEKVHEMPKGWRRRVFLLLTKATRGFWKFTPYRRSIPLNLVPMFGLEKLLKHLDPDVVHVQWVAMDAVSFEQLGRLCSFVKPGCEIVFNLHDLNIVLHEGGHPRDKRFIEGYTSGNSSAFERWMVSRKKRMVERASPVFIGPSEWVCALFRQSKIGDGCRAFAISNIISFDFSFDSKLESCREKFVILFGCWGGLHNSWKGWPDFVAALESLPREVTSRMEVCVFGESRSDMMVNGIPVRIVGKVVTTEKMREIYHHAGVLAFPSLMETQGMVKCEALCCGLPVVAFDRAACAEGIVHLQNGWIAQDGDIKAFADGIMWAYGKWHQGDQKSWRRQIAAEARREFDAQTIVRQVIVVYQTANG